MTLYDYKYTPQEFASLTGSTLDNLRNFRRDGANYGKLAKNGVHWRYSDCDRLEFELADGLRELGGNFASRHGIARHLTPRLLHRLGLDATEHPLHGWTTLDTSIDTRFALVSDRPGAGIRFTDDVGGAVTGWGGGPVFHVVDLEHLAFSLIPTVEEIVG